jgi:predicted RNA binding protein YcfA (HicA-like mRNA interferase family)
MKYCAKKEIDQMIRHLIREGWRFRRGSKHGRLPHPTGWPTVTVAKSPSDHRSLQNFRRDLRCALSSVRRGGEPFRLGSYD